MEAALGDTERFRGRRRARPPQHRLELAAPELRDELLEYLRGGGWLAEPTGKHALRVRWGGGSSRPNRTERINLPFSVAVWQAMHDQAEVRIGFAS